MLEAEPNWDSIEKDSLPGLSNFEGRYIHHYIKDGKKDSDGVFTSGDMFLHTVGLSKAIAEAEANSAPDYIVKHLQRHRAAIGFTEAGRVFEEVSKSIDTISEGEEIISQYGEKILNLIEEYKFELEKKSQEKGNLKDKIKVAEEVTNTFAVKTVTLVKKIICTNIHS